MNNETTTINIGNTIGQISKILINEFKNDFWKGTVKDRKTTLQKLHNQLNTIYSRNTKLITSTISNDKSQWTHSYMSFYNKELDIIVLAGKISLITYLHEYGHALNLNEENAQAYAKIIFKLAYPDKFKKLIQPKDKNTLIIEQQPTKPTTNNP